MTETSIGPPSLKEQAALALVAAGVFDNLELVTRSENTRHAYRVTGRCIPQRGERNTQAKLTRAKVGEIRQLASSGILQRDIASRMGIHRSLVSRILNGKKWQEQSL